MINVSMRTPLKSPLCGEFWPKARDWSINAVGEIAHYSEYIITLLCIPESILVSFKTLELFHMGIFLCIVLHWKSQMGDEGMSLFCSQDWIPQCSFLRGLTVNCGIQQAVGWKAHKSKEGRKRVTCGNTAAKDAWSRLLFRLFFPFVAAD